MKVRMKFQFSTLVKLGLILVGFILYFGTATYWIFLSNLFSIMTKVFIMTILAMFAFDLLEFIVKKLSFYTGTMLNFFFK